MNQYFCRKVAAFCCALLSSLVPAGVPAQAAAAPAAEQQRFPIISMHHTSWTARDGAPKIILFMAQTPDGWLWLASTSGLFRFDGVTFSRYVPTTGTMPSSGIGAILARPDGEVWISYRFGGIGRIRNGVLRNYDEADGLPLRAVTSIEATPDGRIWAVTAEGLFVKTGERWQVFTRGLNLDFRLPGVHSVLADGRGALWALQGSAVLKLDPGAGAFRTLEVQQDNGGTLTEAADGSIWTRGGRNYLSQMLQGPTPVRPPAGLFQTATSKYLVFARDNATWTQLPAGVERSRQHGGRAIIERLDHLQGLSGIRVSSMLEDREGNVWIATDGGLDRFRRNKLSVADLPPVRFGEGRAIVADSQGGVWTDGFYLPGADQPPVSTASMPTSPLTEIFSLYREPDGTIWAGGYGSLAYAAPASRQFRKFALPPDAAGRPVLAIAKSADGVLWVTLTGLGVFKFQDGQWARSVQFPGLEAIPPNCMTADGAGRLWFGYRGNRIALRQHGKLTLYHAADGISVGAVAQIYPEGRHVWIGGENGVAHFDGKRFVGIKGQGGEAFLGTSGITQSAEGDLWLHGTAGISRIHHADMVRAVTEPGFLVPFTRLDHEDGLLGAAPQMAPLPTAVTGADGRLWFTASDSVVSLDPGQSLRNPVVPAVQVLAVKASADGRSRTPADAMRFAAGTESLEFDYTALSLVMPERMRFKYRLEGVDRDWQDAGTRRSAFYTSLAPGRYHFMVKASNNDGVWNDAGASVSLTIEPTVWQSAWFRACAALAAVAALWALHRQRLRVVAGRIHARLAERIDERERIARELHDTYLQAVQGMVLHVHAAAQTIPNEEPGRGLVEAALERADDVFLEGRERILVLRNQMTSVSLQQELQAYADTWSGAAAACEIVVRGQERDLHPIVFEEVYAIAREALANAFRHAQASQVRVLIAYDAGELSVCIQDDGRGVDPDILHAGGVDGHWGMAGMRERAASIDARLTIGALERGSEVRLRLSAILAYQRPVRPRFWRRLFG